MSLLINEDCYAGGEEPWAMNVRMMVLDKDPGVRKLASSNDRQEVYHTFSTNCDGGLK